MTEGLAIEVSNGTELLIFKMARRTGDKFALNMWLRFSQHSQASPNVHLLSCYFREVNKEVCLSELRFSFGFPTADQKTVLRKHSIQSRDGAGGFNESVCCRGPMLPEKWICACVSH